MKEKLKNFLKSLKIYHPLQSLYRDLIEIRQKFNYRLKYRKFKGQGYTCNFCGAQYKHFVPSYPEPNIAAALYNNNVIAGPGENVYCPNCLSKNRERLVKAVLENIFNIKGKYILHFSPEKHLFNYLKQFAHVKTADITPGFYSNIDSSVFYADATNLQFQDKSFDIVIANHILEHIPDDTAAMKEIYRVLTKDGFAVLQVPFSETLPTTIEDPYIKDPIKQEKLYGQKDHVRIYSLNDYVSRLTKAGFSVKLLSPEQLKPFRKHAIQEKEYMIIGYK